MADLVIALPLTLVGRCDMDILTLREQHRYEEAIAELESAIKKLKSTNDEKLVDARRRLKIANMLTKRWKGKYEEIVKKRSW